MATVNFLYRSTKDFAPLNIRLLHTSSDGKNHQLGARLQLEVGREYWENFHNKTRIKDIDLKNLQSEIRTELSKIENFVLGELKSSDLDSVPKDWLKNKLEEYYDPNRGMEFQYPLGIVKYAEFYAGLRRKDWSPSTAKSHRNTISKLKRMEEEWGTTIMLSDVNEDFKQRYIEFCDTHLYSPNTMQREFVRFKEYCSHAKKNELKIYKHLDKLTVKGEETNDIFLSESELEIIRDTTYNNQRLENVRDLLLVSCYTGQRVSDFMRFDKSMIRKENGINLLEFQQKKAPNKWVSVPIISELQSLLDERGGFPVGISEQKYNDYCKEVCQIAGLTQITKGAKRINVSPDGQPTSVRIVKGQFPKCELVSSHTGRRSFATNYFGRIPTVYLMQVTGHSRESTFLKYIKKSSTDLAMEAYRLIEALKN